MRSANLIFHPQKDDNTWPFWWSAALRSIRLKPRRKRERCLGGAATYFSLAASYFTDVRVIARGGRGLWPRQEAVFTARNIDTRGIEHAPGKSFFWSGSYLENLNEAKTHSTELNVFGDFEPKIPEPTATPSFSFWPTSIRCCRRVRSRCRSVKLVAGDTMNYWIKDHRENLLEGAARAGYAADQRHRSAHAAGEQNLLSRPRGRFSAWGRRPWW